MLDILLFTLRVCPFELRGIAAIRRDRVFAIAIAVNRFAIPIGITSMAGIKESMRGEDDKEKGT